MVGIRCLIAAPAGSSARTTGCLPLSLLEDGAASEWVDGEQQFMKGWKGLLEVTLMLCRKRVVRKSKGGGW